MHKVPDMAFLAAVRSETLLVIISCEISMSSLRKRAAASGGSAHEVQGLDPTLGALVSTTAH